MGKESHFLNKSPNPISELHRSPDNINTSWSQGYQWLQSIDQLPDTPDFPSHQLCFFANE